MPDPLITWAGLRAGGACARGIRAHFPALRKAGVSIPRRYSTLAIPLSEILRDLGVEAALDAVYYQEVDEPWLRLFACDCASRSLLRERVAGREPDPRSWAAVDVARRYALGEATAEELSTAWDAAWWAAASAASAAADRDAERRWQAERLSLYLQGGEIPPVEAP